MEVRVWGHPISKSMIQKFVSGDFWEKVIWLPPIVPSDDTPVCLGFIVCEPGHINIKWVAKGTDPVNQ